AKAANVMAFSLIAGACAVATGHALRIGSKNRIIDYRWKDLIECTIVCDSDIGGEENLQVFHSLWERSYGAHPLLAASRNREITIEQRLKINYYSNALI
ncbi:MAG: hypothetical protein ACR2FI_07885, partial [Burkholderiales bacterium]